MGLGWFTLGLLLGAAFSALAVLAYGNFINAYLCIAIVVGGMGGGLTAALSGGESMGLRLPARSGNCDVKFDPGFVGDLFVGLMSAFLGIGVAGRTLRTDLFKESPLAELWFMDFSIAFVCGFLGLKFIKVVSKRFLAEMNEKIDAVERQVTAADREIDATAIDTLFLKAREALDAKQFSVADEMFTELIRRDGAKSIRGYIGLAKTQRQCRELGRAIATLNDAIIRRDTEPKRDRIAVALWNRACYRVVACEDGAEARSEIFADLQEAITIQPLFRKDLNIDPDLQKLHGDATFETLAKPAL